MNREIKFRAWDGNSMAFFRLGGDLPSEKDLSWLTDQTVTQSTGLYDRHGNEIYEGDIVRVGDDLVEEVKWIAGGDWMGDKQPMVGFISHGTIYKDEPIEIIGNVYEHPHLLTNE